MYPTQKAKQIDCPRLLSRLALFFFKKNRDLVCLFLVDMVLYKFWLLPSIIRLKAVGKGKC
jgi:hypothetical protein